MPTSDHHDVPPLRWGLIATGNIARKFTTALDETDSGEVVACASRSHERAAAFARDFPGIQSVYGSYDELLADPDIDAVYLSTPHPMHERWAVKTIEAGKHLLCEKPIAMTEAEARGIVDAARSAGVFLMEAFMYRCTQQTRTVVELLREGAIGDVRTIDATFCFDIGDRVGGRHLDKSLGGGGILDIGCYPVSFARLVAAVALGQSVSEPSDVLGAGHVGATGVDEHATAVLRFDRDIVARCACAIRVDEPTRAIVAGSRGHLVVRDPWAFGKAGAATDEVLVYESETSEPRRVPVSIDRPIYALEADEVARCIRDGRTESPAMSWNDTLANMRTLDRWRAAIGLRYDADRSGA